MASVMTTLGILPQPHDTACDYGCRGPRVKQNGERSPERRRSPLPVKDALSNSPLERRTVLKGAAAGVAVWAAPSVLSIGSVASAASNQPCGPFNCSGPLMTCKEYGCLCGSTVEGKSVCTSGAGFCDDCNSDADCGEGYYCMALTDCGCGPQGNACLANDCSDAGSSAKHTAVAPRKPAQQLLVGR
jgi:hypothetical protein